MSREQHSNKEAHKKPAMTLKEKRAAKRAKREGRKPVFIETEKKSLH
jgi:hypothetical protein